MDRTTNGLSVKQFILQSGFFFVNQNHGSSCAIEMIYISGKEEVVKSTAH